MCKLLLVPPPYPSASSVSSVVKIARQQNSKKEIFYHGEHGGHGGILRGKSLLSLSLIITLWFGLITPIEAYAQEVIGPVRYCVAPPAFTRELGIRVPAFMTTHRTRMGLLLFDGSKLDSTGGFTGEAFQDPSWQSSGWLGPLAFDRAGNIYTAPVPHVNLLNNPLEKQNTLLKVGTIDRKLVEFLHLPVKHGPSALNPFGIVGLSYDCDTDILYATTLSGSTEQELLGSVFAISLKSNNIIAELSGVDALGVAAFNSGKGKRLYLGSARNSAIFEQELSSDGDFLGRPRELFNFDRYNQTRARKITIDTALNMQIEAVEFNYNLIASTELSQHTYRYKFSRSDRVWKMD